MVKIAFWDNCLCERGTTTAIYDYAYYNQTLLGNTSIIMYNTTRRENNNEVINKFKQQFTVYGVDNFEKVDPILLAEQCDIFYIIKAGEYEGQISRVIKTVVHCVFNCYQPHGHRYAAVSNWVSGASNHSVVPHIVTLPENNNHLRQELNIPDSAIVFGRHGGYDTFDIPYVHNTVYRVAIENPNIYFLFMNTQQFCPPLPNIIHIGQIIDLNKKTAFINTCDAMLWGRTGGETFGLAIAEFSIRNKPVFATKCGDIDHIEILKDKGIWYNETNLYDQLTTFDRIESANKDWNAYRDYEPEKVMSIFKRIFIDK